MIATRTTLLGRWKMPGYGLDARRSRTRRMLARFREPPAQTGSQKASSSQRSGRRLRELPREKCGHHQTLKRHFVTIQSVPRILCRISHREPEHSRNVHKLKIAFADPLRHRQWPVGIRHLPGLLRSAISITPCPLKPSSFWRTKSEMLR